MQFFTLEEFYEIYSDYSDIEIPTWYINASCEMIFSQIGLRYRDTSWTTESVPSLIKEASMEQLRFMIEHDIPFVDSQDVDSAGMKAHLKSDYSTRALRILGIGGYLYRGNPLNHNMGMTIPFGE